MVKPTESLAPRIAVHVAASRGNAQTASIAPASKNLLGEIRHAAARMNGDKH